jgi:hypothetical protein
MTMAPSKADIAACLRKTRWSSERSARWALQNIRSESDNRMKRSVRAYRCRSCRKWHLGGSDS